MKEHQIHSHSFGDLSWRFTFCIYKCRWWSSSPIAALSLKTTMIVKTSFPVHPAYKCWCSFPFFLNSIHQHLHAEKTSKVQNLDVHLFTICLILRKVYFYEDRLIFGDLVWLPGKSNWSCIEYSLTATLLPTPNLVLDPVLFLLEYKCNRERGIG